ncbi:uncharacterized protein MELLADRAFT_61028 [Melampsora larici-populina 98AG31]|uniref:Uncharacterized protein n=1 Tax=Melampsora larici-populina (strain 98AG31 / pathotype 3-4-7) TaxID=747676 RepID=F4RDB6_MELLP|nr:uncharacterized protein MELLADRAFT_61028 [Melampsora larici-populina 98AG31]EGG09373.1 hypothetical protein MELLADRAFT_61028 [Melampsora larici-populina 98AG31]
MKLLRIQSTVAYFKNCATKAKIWLSFTTRRFHRSRQSFDPSSATTVSPAGVSLSPPSTPVSPASFTSPVSSTPSSTPISLMSIDNSLVTPPFVPYHELYTGLATPLLFSPTSSTILAPDLASTASDTSPMSIDPPSIGTLEFFQFHAHSTITNSPTSIRLLPTSITTNGSSQITSLPTTQSKAGRKNWIEVARELHRQSPTPTASSHPCPALVTSTPDDLAVTQLAARTPRPYANYQLPSFVANLSPPPYEVARKRCLSMDDDLVVHPCKRRKSTPSMKKWRLSLSIEDEHTGRSYFLG